LCGIGNWLVDEILYQSAIHPAQRCNTLTSCQLSTLHIQIQTVINKSVEVNADHKLFPSHWLFKYRWGKGRISEHTSFILPDGTKAVVTHMTVGGRTSAIVESVQKLLGDSDMAADGHEDEENEYGGEKNRMDGDRDFDEDEKLKAKKSTASRKSKVQTNNSEKGKAKKRVHGSAIKTKKTSVRTKRRKRVSDSDSESALSDLTDLNDVDGAEEKEVLEEIEKRILKITPSKRSRKSRTKMEVEEEEEPMAEIDKVELSPPKKRGRDVAFS